MTCSKSRASFAQSPPNRCSLIMSDMRGTVKAPSTSPEIQDPTAPSLGQHWGPIGQLDDVAYSFQGLLDSLGLEIAVVAIIGASFSTLVQYLRSCLLLRLSRSEVSGRSPPACLPPTLALTSFPAAAVPSKRCWTAPACGCIASAWPRSRPKQLQRVACHRLAMRSCRQERPPRQGVGEQQTTSGSDSEILAGHKLVPCSQALQLCSLVFHRVDLVHCCKYRSSGVDGSDAPRSPRHFGGSPSPSEPGDRPGGQEFERHVLSRLVLCAKMLRRPGKRWFATDAFFVCQEDYKKLP